MRKKFKPFVRLTKESVRTYQFMANPDVNILTTK